MARSSTPIMFSTDAYQWAHGKAPRGEGMWAIKFSSCRKGDAGTIEWFRGKFGEVRKDAMKHARSIGAILVEVQS